MQLMLPVRAPKKDHYLHLAIFVVDKAQSPWRENPLLALSLVVWVDIVLVSDSGNVLGLDTDRNPELLRYNVHSKHVVLFPIVLLLYYS
jgi:hypothetical protein